LILHSISAAADISGLVI